MPLPTLSNGDLVTLRSGGPIMVAGQVFLNVAAPFARCSWFDEHGKAKSAAFALDALQSMEQRRTKP
jgi:uncharacterized protein YodC (DUF2158 family)